MEQLRTLWQELSPPTPDWVPGYMCSMCSHQNYIIPSLTQLEVSSGLKLMTTAGSFSLAPPSGRRLTQREKETLQLTDAAWRKVIQFIKRRKPKSNMNHKVKRMPQVGTLQ